jgi:outer membrane receptor for ferrienterochelin and colicins
MKTYLAGILFLQAAVGAYAQDSLKAIQLDEVIVTGQYEPQSVSKSVYQVRTLSGDRLQSRGASTLSDVLNTELNFRFSQDLVLGTSSVSMNGLPAQYVKVLIDGVPVVGKGADNDINLSQINLNTIERIEIVDGPMSVAYGADALAGVINIITKKAYANKLSLSARLQEETVGKEYNATQGVHNQYLALSYAGKNLYTKAEAGRNYSGGFKGEALGREKTWNPKTQWLATGVIGFKNNHLNVYYRLDALNESISNPGAFSSGVAFDQKYTVNRFMHQLQGDVELTDKLGYTGAIAYTDYSRKTQSVNVDESTGRETLALGEGQQDRTAFTGLTARGTFQYKISPKFSLQPGYDVNIETGRGGRLKEGSHAIEDYAFFVSAEYSPLRFVSIRPGVRMIENSQYDAPPIITSVNTKFKLSKHIDLRASYGRGFRAPSLRELYFNFFDANHSMEGNPNLEPEYSHSFNASVSWLTFEKNSLSIQNTISGFYNSIDNMIAFISRPDNVYSYFNIEHNKTQGFNAVSKLKYFNLNVTGGFSYTGQYNRFSEGSSSSPKFVWSPEFNTSVSYVFTKPGIVANFFYKHTGTLYLYKQEVVDNETVTFLTSTGSFDWFDLSLKKKIFNYVDFTLGARNIFNVTRISDTRASSAHNPSTGTTPVSPGRSFFATLNFQLTK